jgi:prealbumin domain-containing protein
MRQVLGRLTATATGHAKRGYRMTRGSRRTRWLVLLSLAVTAAAAVVFIPSAGADSVKAQTFELDGNIAQTHPGAPTTYDWANFFDSSGAKILPLPTGYTASTFVRDFNTTTDRKGNTVFDTNDASTYTIGSKDTLDVSGWSCTPANNVTDKGDIMNAYAAAYTGPDGHKFFYFALERNANAGDANVAFWFLQGGASCPAAGGSFTGSHQNGDLLIVSAFTNGGTVSTIDAYEWLNGALNTTPVAHGVDCSSASASADPICATSNTTTLGSIPWLTENKDDGVGHSLRSGEFFEGGIDLSAPTVNLANNCFNTFIPDTRSSQSLTATLYDFAVGQLGECHSTTSTMPVDADNHADPPASTIPLAPADAKVTVQDKTVIGTTGAPSTFNSSNSTNLSWHICGPTLTTSTQLCDGTTGNVGVAAGSTAITAAGTYFSPTVTVTAAGRYCFRADFAGDSAIGLPGSSDSSPGECFIVAPVQPTLTTNATSAVEIGGALDDTATLAGTANQKGSGGPSGSDGSINPASFGGSAKGSITFTLWSPNASTHCGTALGTSTINVNGNADYKASDGSTKTGTFTPSAPGTYYWTASYTGDLPNTKSANDACNGSNETSVVVDARIKIEGTATNEVGHSHTFTVTFEQNDGTGWSAVPVGTKPTVSISPLPGTVTDNCGSTGTGALGTCTVVINSSTPDVFTANASGSVTVAGVSLTRDTNSATAGVPCGGGASSCGPAVKTYVDARIKIEGTATNEVGHSHTFTVTFEQNDGTGWSAVPVGTKPTVSISPAPGSKTDNCASTGTGALGTCTVVINNSTPGVFTANASGSVTVGGVSLTRDTDSTTAGVPCGGGTTCGPAVKTYVDARIKIEGTATNEVGHSHTFTVTFEQNDGTGWTAVPVGTKPTVSISPLPGTVTDNCASTGTNASGVCTVVINSSTAGVFTANASGSVTVGGVSLTRDTDSATANPCGGGTTCGPAVKTYVDAYITITPQSAANPVGTDHVLTISVYVNDGSGSGYVLTGGVPVTASLVNSGGATADFDPTGANTCTTSSVADSTLGTCTVTIKSPTPGQTKIHASFSNLNVGGVLLSRATGDGISQDSPDATKNWGDANIAITPLTPVNEVGHAEVFTVTFTAAGTGTPDFTTGTNGITIGVSPTPDTTNTNTCASPVIDITGTVATCTVTINNSVPGTFTVTATGKVTVDGIQFTRQTGDNAHGDSPSAVKTYVDARLKIEGTATNEVGRSHTFTVTFEQNDGTNGWQPVPVGTKPTVSISPAPGSKTDNCGSTGTGALGTCTVVINSSTPGVFTANASGSVTVGGVSLTRDTDSTTAGVPCGGGTTCGPAVKTYVDALITITPSQTNGITEPHTFTVHVAASDGSTTTLQPVSGVKPTVTLTPAGGAVVSGKTDNCASTGTNASGDCTVTFTSNSAGTVTGNASITLTLAGISVTRTTGDSHTGDSADAVKTFVQGSLKWIKHDGGGNLLGGATFQVCATGGTAASTGHTPLCVTVLDNVGQLGYTGADSDATAGQFELDKYQSFGGSALAGLALGTYTIQETVAPAGYTLDPFIETITIDQSHLNPSATHIWVDTQPGQGCTPGFWKNHTAAWDSSSDSTVSHLLPFLTSPFGYDPSKLGGPPPSKSFNNQPFFGYGNPQTNAGIFGLPGGPYQGLSSTLTLIGALNLGGGGYSALARHGTAGLLSSGSVQYPYSPSQVLNGVRNAFLSPTGNYNLASTTFPDGVLTDLTNANNLDEKACPSS